MLSQTVPGWKPKSEIHEMFGNDKQSSRKTHLLINSKFLKSQKEQSQLPFFSHPQVGIIKNQIPSTDAGS
jgi:hypothetical protein